MQAKDSRFREHWKLKIDIPGDTLPEKGGSFGGEATGVITGRTGGDFPGKSFTGIVTGAEEKNQNPNQN